MLVLSRHHFNHKLMVNIQPSCGTIPKLLFAEIFHDIHKNTVKISHSIAAQILA